MSFGTLVWTAPPGDPIYTSFDDALAACQTAAAAFRARPEVRGLISVGRGALADDVLAAMSAPNVRVERWVDQWQALQQADVFITHHGLNSTHEAILHEVPMVSYPFFVDHPAMARTSQRLGLAVPLTPGHRDVVSVEQVHAAIDTCLAQREAMAQTLAQARQWELDTIERRGEVLDRIVSLV
jgi:UDP:flavonoid glycosyltransferase YjiC (YdhE family)